MESAVHEAQLRRYYEHFYPAKNLIRWFKYDAPETMHRREFSFAFSGQDDRSIIKRFVPFRSGDELRAYLVGEPPLKIDVGPLYSHPVGSRSAHPDFRAVAREFVFDIDATDFDAVRTCCAGAAVCARCWALMDVSVAVFDQVLRRNFGFEDLLFVFSGRRGVHCWVCDARARGMATRARHHVAESFVFVRDTARAPVIHFSLLDPIQRFVHDRICRPAFLGRVLGDMGWMSAHGRALPAAPPPSSAVLRVADTRGVFRVAFLLQEFGFPQDLLLKWWRRVRAEHGADGALRAPTSAHALWRALEELAKGRRALREVLARVVIYFTYPRIDIMVTKGMNHLLKAPFCVHPATQQVCTPIDPRHVTDAIALLDETLGEELAQPAAAHGPCPSIERMGASYGDIGPFDITKPVVLSDVLDAMGKPENPLTPFLAYFETFVKSFTPDEDAEAPAKP
eukprot:gnl/Chilomastix_cuspidata/3772.p1 GENE.gnl/Chilomastix_cuspidata/3772~~gnl/Chilomastix_cuspidata/3772.p1  ORF type:complete len:453 (+),score=245.56 gnl/Chilomastix_cuspidata/3772:40-1398(+)